MMSTSNKLRNKGVLVYFTVINTLMMMSDIQGFSEYRYTF